MYFRVSLLIQIAKIKEKRKQVIDADRLMKGLDCYHFRARACISPGSLNLDYSQSMKGPNKGKMASSLPFRGK